MSKFADSIDYVLANEGGYVNNPNDPGGCTNFGLTLEDCIRYPNSGIKNCNDLQKMSVALAKKIYLAQYWKYESIHDSRVATKMFDMAVHMGPFANVLFQRAANSLGASLKCDGVLGDKTIAIINTFIPAVYLTALIEQSEQYYARVVEHKPHLAEFFQGWMNRAKKIPL